MTRTDTNELIEFLNDLVAIDAKAVTDLVNSRVQCNEALADHPSVQVGGDDGKPETFRIGMLGLLNGYCGTVDEGEKAGWGPITAEFDGDTITRFVRTEGEGALMANGPTSTLTDDGGLREALEKIAQSRVGLQNIAEDYGHDANAYNFQAMKYFAAFVQELQRIARQALGGAK